MQITKEKIESLLFEDEGTALDLKREQYPFEGANKEQKSELLKDILAFANAFRRADAFILIGVEEVKGGRSIVTGVSKQLDDAKLQQFVNEKTQRPVTFSYRQAEHNGLPIGIIHIPVQHRPIYITSGYGKLQKGTVYLRRGSSTGIAGPEEIAQMGADQAAPEGAEPAFELEIKDRYTGKSLGRETSLHCTWLEIPDPNAIPDYRERRERFGPTYHTNRNYYRELAEFTRAVHFLQPTTLALTNTGGVSAHDVRLVFEIDDPEGRLFIIEDRKLPKRPESHSANYNIPMPGSMAINASIYVSRKGDTWLIECSFGKIQPKEIVELGSDLYFGSKQGGKIAMEGHIYADNVSSPRSVQLALDIRADNKNVSIEEIEQLELERFLDTEEGRELLASAEDD